MIFLLILAGVFLLVWLSTRLKDPTSPSKYDIEALLREERKKRRR